MSTFEPQRTPNAVRYSSGGGGGAGRGQKVVLAVLSVLVVAAASVVAVAAFRPELIGLDSDDTTTTGSTLPGGDEGDVLAALIEVTSAIETGKDLSALTFAGDTTTAAAQADYATLVEGLGDFTVEITEGEVSFADDAGATVATEAAWTFADGRTWTSVGQASVVQDGDGWKVDWSPALLEASLGVGDLLRRSTVEPTRAPIVARDGSVLVGTVDQVTVGVQPSRISDLPGLVSTLEQLVGADPTDLTARIEAASPDAFVEVTTLAREDYELIREQIFPLPGTVFRESSTPTNTDADLARALLGRSGEVTAEIMEENPGLFEVGDIVGISGIQEQFNEQLSGRDGMEIEVVRAVSSPSSTTTGTGLITTAEVRRANEAEVLFTEPAVEGEPVILTIDPTYQRVAEEALATTEKTSSMVVIQVSTGQVLAVANGPTGNSVNFAMTGRYPPGSIFKVVTGYAIVRDRMTLQDEVDCPNDITVQGRTFGNAEGEATGRMNFLTAFANSCNTAFVNASRGMGLDVLNRTGAEMGLGVDYQLGAEVFSGDVPVNTDEVDFAAAAFGQGRTLVSPFSAAVMTATAAGGVYRSPVLVTSGTPAAQVVQQLEPGAAEDLRTMMRAVVTQGTATIMGGVPGGPVSGKTGTAEFGSDVPPKTHAWFVGFQGDLAFAVLVEDGGFGGAAAAPLAARFLAAVDGVPPAGTAPPSGSGQTDGSDPDAGDDVDEGDADDTGTDPDDTGDEGDEGDDEG